MNYSNNLYSLVTSDFFQDQVNQKSFLFSYSIYATSDLWLVGFFCICYNVSGTF